MMRRRSPLTLAGVFAGLILVGVAHGQNVDPAAANLPKEVEVAGRTIPILWPPNKSGWVAPGLSAAVQNPTLYVDGRGRVVERVLRDGGYGDLEAMLAELPPASERAPLRIRVLIFTRNTSLFSNGAGSYLSRSSIERLDVAVLWTILARFQVMAEAVTGNRVQLSVDQDDSLMRVSAPFLNPNDGAESAAPWLLEKPFEADAGRLLPPTDAVVVIHSGLTSGSVQLYGSLPVVSVPYHNGLGRNIAVEGPHKLTEALAQALWMRWAARTGNVLPGQSVTLPVSQMSWTRSLGSLQMPPALNQNVDPALLGVQPLEVRGSGFASLNSVPFFAASAIPATATRKGWRGYPPQIELDEGADVTFTPSSGVVERVVTLKATGNFSATAVQDPNYADAFEVTRLDLLDRGDVTLPVELPGTPGVLEFAYRTTGRDAQVLGFHNSMDPRSGPQSVVYIGNEPSWPRTENLVPVPNDGQWHTVRVAVPEGAVRVTLTTAVPGMAHIRADRGPAPVRFAGLKFTLDRMALSPVVSAPDPDPNVLGLLASNREDAIVTALVRIAREGIGDADPSVLLPLILPNVNSVNPLMSQLGVDAVNRFPETIRSSTLATLMQSAPFTHTRVAASRYVSPMPEDGIRSLGRAVVEPLWFDRFLVVPAALQFPGIQGEAIIHILLEDPHPSVRMAVARAYRPTSELGVRRMMFSAVNDPSDLVRAHGRASLFALASPEARREALNVLTDDSPLTRSVALTLMAAQTDAPKREELRPVLERALADAEPIVVIAAVQAIGAESLTAAQRSALLARNLPAVNQLLAP